VLDLAAGVVQRFEPAAVERGVDLRIDGTSCIAEVDHDLLGQAIGNLVSNALTYTDPGGTVTLSVVPAETSVDIAVADTGCGIAAEDLPHVFDRFYRVDRSRDRRRGGSGLGLEITRRIVEAHGGTVDATSRIGEGSSFRIRLPRASRSAAR
jgi:two-component system sensor histidine kinase BaeS